MGIIYCCRNKINGKLYIGKTTKSLDSRIRQHVYDSKYNRTAFHKAISKYGICSFCISILDSSDDNEQLSMMEQIYIDMFSSCIRECGYNLTYGGDGGTLNADSISKMAMSKRGKPSSRKGIKHRPESIEKLKASLKIARIGKTPHMLGKHHSDESKAKISESKRMATKHESICVACGTAFYATNNTAIYCSHKCKLRAFRARSKENKSNEH